MDSATLDHAFAPISESATLTYSTGSGRHAVFSLPAQHPLPSVIRHPSLGIPKQIWQYFDHARQLLFVTCRYEPTGRRKEVLPYTCGPSGWEWKAPPAPRPLYGLERLADRPQAPVLVVEGEKTADRAAELFGDYVVVTWQGGSNAVAKADWRSLAGRQIAVWPDADAAGAAAATNVAKAVVGVSAGPVALVAVPKDWPEGWDVADLDDDTRPQPDDVSVEMLCEMLSQALAAAGALKPSEKRPLFRPTPPAPEFPVAALGPLREAAEAIQMRTQAPLAMCANSVLAAAALATQAQRDVELPGGGQKPLTAIFVSVADSGERKTSVDKLALAPVYRMEEAWRGDHDAALNSYNNDKEAWKEAREAVKKRSKGDRAAIREGLDQVGPEPKAPPHPMLLVADPTPEALVLHLRDSRPWAGVFTAEGGILVGGAAFNDESRMRTGALFNTLWDGEPIRRTRVGTGAAFLPGRRCTSHVMLQPVVADKLFGDPMLDGIGMLARTLLVAPDSTAGRRLFRETSVECRATLDAYGSRLEYLLRRPPATKADDASVLDPPVLRLHPDAAELWIQFHDAAEVALLPGGDYAAIKAFGAKLGEHAGRLAAVLTVYADPDAMEVPAAMMACGITLAQHYAAEMLRLQGASTVSPDLRLAARLLAWWQARPDARCHAAAIYQRGPSALRDNSIARRIVGILEEHGFVRRLPAGTELDNEPRRDAWELLP